MNLKYIFSIALLIESPTFLLASSAEKTAQLDDLDERVLRQDWLGALQSFINSGASLEGSLELMVKLHCRWGFAQLLCEGAPIQPGLIMHMMMQVQDQDEAHQEYFCPRIIPLKLLINHFEDIHINHQDAQGTTALMVAAQKQRVDFIERLLAKNADPAIQNSDGNTYKEVGLLAAIESGNSKRRQDWLAQGANPNARSQGKSCRALASQPKLPTNLQLLLKRIKNPQSAKGTTALMIAAPQNAQGTTALMFAAQRQRVGLIASLLEKKANPTIKNSEENTYKEVGLLSAIMRGNIDHVRYWIEQGANPNACSQGKSCLALASQLKSPAILELLLNRKADPNKYNNFYKSALATCMRQGDAFIPHTELLLMNGAKHPMANRKLGFAIRARQIKLAQTMLLNCEGINTRIPDYYDGKSAERYALRLYMGDESPFGAIRHLAYAKVIKQRTQLPAIVCFAIADFNPSDAIFFYHADRKNLTLSQAIAELDTHSFDSLLNSQKITLTKQELTKALHQSLEIDIELCLEALDSDRERVHLRLLYFIQRLIECGADINDQSNPKKLTPLMKAAKCFGFEPVALIAFNNPNRSLADAAGKKALEGHRLEELTLSDFFCSAINYCWHNYTSLSDYQLWPEHTDQPSLVKEALRKGISCTQPAPLSNFSPLEGSFGLRIIHPLMVQGAIAQTICDCSLLQNISGLIVVIAQYCRGTTATTIIEGIEEGDIQAVQEMAKSEPLFQPLSRALQLRNRDNPYLDRAKYHFTQIISELIANCTEIDAQSHSPEKLTPLMLLAQQGTTEEVHQLLARKPNIKLTNSAGFSADKLQCANLNIKTALEEYAGTYAPKQTKEIAQTAQAHPRRTQQVRNTSCVIQ